MIDTFWERIAALVVLYLFCHFVISFENNLVERRELRSFVNGIVGIALACTVAFEVLIF